MAEPFRVSDSTIETAARAAFAHDYRVMGREWIADRPPERYHQEMVRKAIEAVLPSLVAEIRAQQVDAWLHTYPKPVSDQVRMLLAEPDFDRIGCISNDDVRAIIAELDAARAARGDAG